MLHYETVEPDTLSVLNNLLELPELQDFALVGGTALSLLYGHRISVDLNLFSSKPFENKVLVRALQSQFGASLDVRSTNPRFGVL
jgi:Nucleotidyl transferase AbiEii toxin, Type IV TA system